MRQDLARLRGVAERLKSSMTNPELEELLRSEGVEVVEGCTLVMLSTNQY